MSFEQLGLEPQLLRAVSDEGYTQPTPVQEQCIRPILEGRDIMARAQTGTGKTAGFALPLLQRLNADAREKGNRSVRALILAPTRELAVQVEQSIRTYGRHLRLKSAAVYGGVGFGAQVQAFRRGVEILVATPGRLLDHVSQRTVDLSRVEILVLDEADRMLDMGFIHDIRKIIALLPKTRQNLMFSATFSKEIQALASGILVSPARVDIAPKTPAADGVAQVVHPVDRDRKGALLVHLLGSPEWQQVLVFTRTKRGADRLTKQLARDGVRTTAIHGDKTQGARLRALGDFKRGAIRVLVATDVAARGLDIDRLSHVVNFELPHVAEDYVHRIGRTGRAGQSGDAVSLVSSEERDQLRAIERLLAKDVPSVVISGFEPTGKASYPVAPRRFAGGGRPGWNRYSQGASRSGSSSPSARSSRRRRAPKPPAR